MYFVAKGTISFSLSKEYLEKEIKEVKKNNNFGEIEMCLNEKLNYNIKVKSRNCELFVLKKNDFLRLSVNFKEFIEKFLQKSLMLYLRFNDERKRLMREMEESKLIVGGGNDSARKDNDKNNDLDKISEQEEEDQGNASEEFDIYNHQTSNDKSKKSSKNNSKSASKKATLTDKFNLQSYEPNNQAKKNSLFEHQESLKNKKKEKNSDESANSSPRESQSRQSDIKEANQKPKKENAFTNQRSYLSNKSGKESKKSKSIDSDRMSNVMKNLIANPDPDIEELSANDINHMNMELSEHFEKKKHKINKTFMEKVDKIIAFLEANKLEFSSTDDNNPLSMLKKLKDIQDINERNSLIDKIEKIIAEKFKNEKK